MAQTLRLTATLEPRGPAGAFILTDEQVAGLGAGRKVFPVQVRVNGAGLSLRLMRMGGENMIGLAAAARRQAGVELGASYDIEIALDEAERTVEVPADLSAALAADPAVDKAFATLAMSHRKEYVRWVSEAKRDETRANRIAKTVEMVRAGQTR
ncbi:MAG TPA: YdeI/OmpD-associated family protein [Mycobacteriales bacterium]|nr:YdeI/OmpD-associated family protein [Mycobacteriales bacterium]